MKHASPPPWHTTAVEPTPDEFVDWFLSNDRDGRREIAEWSIRFSRESMDCIMRRCGRPR